MDRGPIVGILLAAGAGTRFGGDKLLVELEDATPMALAAAHGLLPACERVLAIVRPGSDVLADCLARAGCEVIANIASVNGMGHSLAAGVRASPDAAGWLVALADMPFVTPGTCARVAAELRAGASIAVPEYRGRRGHPVGFAWHWAARLAALSGDEGARGILAAHPQAIVRCAVTNPGVVRDIDRPEDLPARA